MAPQQKDSISTTVHKSEFHRNSTRDFLIGASQVVLNNSGAHNGLKRYYQMRMNSMLNRDQDDIDYIMRVSDQSTICFKCGNHKQLRIRSRKNKNRSSERRSCRYLRSLVDEYCDKCYEHKVHKLKGRQSILDKLADKEKPKIPQPKNEAKQLLKVFDKPVNTPTTSKRKSSNNKADRALKLPLPKQNLPAFSSRLRAFSCLLKE